MKTENPYGFCPICGAEGVSRERRPNGDDCCRNAHKYPSAKALKEPKKKLDSKEDYVRALAALMPIFTDVDIGYSFQACDFKNEDVFASVQWFPEEITFGKWDELRTLVNNLDIPPAEFWRERKDKEEGADDSRKNKERRLMRRLCVFTKALQRISKLGGVVGLAAEDALTKAPAPELLDDAFRPAAEAAEVIAELWAYYAPISGHAMRDIKDKTNSLRQKAEDDDPTSSRDASNPALESAEAWLKQHHLGGLFPKNKAPKDRVYEAECENERLKRLVFEAKTAASWAKNSAIRDVKKLKGQVATMITVMELVALDQKIPKKTRELAFKVIEAAKSDLGLETKLEDPKEEK